MSRIGQRFAALKRLGRPALIPFLTAGDPHPSITVPLMQALVAAGADLLELGVPFSDPMADGPVIQQANERALKNHVNLSQVLDLVRTFRAHDADTPVVLMGYLNPIEVMGVERFAQAAAAAGVDGAITVDLPPEEGETLFPALERQGIDPVFLLAPTSGPERVELVLSRARGFIYYVALRGVTGAKNLNVDEVKQKLHAIRGRTALPLGVGFGIDGPAAAGRVAAFADAVIVGSALVRRIGALAHTPEKIPTAAGEFIASLRTALDAVAGRPAQVRA